LVIKGEIELHKGENVITYQNIKLVSPYDIKTLTELRIIKRINQHSLLYFSGVIPEEKKDSCIGKATIDDKIEVYQIEGNNKIRTLFIGLVSNISVKCVKGIYYIYVEGISFTHNLDIKSKSRSFQKADMLYKDMIKKVTSDYNGADFQDMISNNAAIEKFIVQYNETDWCFIKRMASHFGAVLVPDQCSDKPKFWFGLPKEKDGYLDNSCYIVKKNLSDYMHTVGNFCNHLDETDFVCFEVESHHEMDIGYKVTFQGIKLVVCSVVADIKNGTLMFKYMLARESGIRQNLIFNSSIIGAAVEGKIIDTRMDTVRVHMEIDGSQTKDDAYWFPYSSFYTAEGNSGWYCMPQHGDSVKVYFPTEREEEAIAINSVRKGGGSLPKTSNPDNKYFGTNFGKEMMMGAKEISFTAKDDEGDKIYIKLNEDKGIEIESCKPIEVRSDKEIILDSNKLSITADEDISLLCGYDGDSYKCSIYMNGNTDLYAKNELKVEGTKKSEINIQDRIAEIEKINKEIEKQKFNQMLDWVQFGLDIVGMIPVVGIVADVASGLISVGRAVGCALEGDWAGAGGHMLSAGLSAVACIPVAGEMAAAGKLGVKAAKFVKSSKTAMNIIKACKYISGALKLAAPVLIALGTKRAIEQIKMGIDGILEDGFDETDLYNLTRGTFDLVRNVWMIKNLYMNNSLTKPHCEGDPINVVNGSFYLDIADLVLDDRGMDVEIRRKYNSVVTRKGLFGTGWTFEYESYIERKSKDHVLLLNKYGCFEEYIKVEGVWEKSYSTDLAEVLTEDEKTGNFTLTLKDMTRYEYNEGGRLTSICDRNGNRLTLQYAPNGFIEKILTPGGKVVSFKHQAGKIVEISDGLGRRVKYGYSDDNLTSVTLPNDGVFSYTYQGNFITSVTDMNGKKYVSNVYDEEGKVIKQCVDGIKIIDIKYDSVNMETTFIHRDTGVINRFKYNIQGLLTEIVYNDGTSDVFEYDKYGNRCSETDRNGRKTCRVIDRRGNILKEIYPNGYIVWTEYGEWNNPVRTYTSGGQETLYKYDANGNLAEIHEKIDEGEYSVVTYTYDAYGRVLTKTDAMNNTTSCQYDKEYLDNPTTVMDPEGNVFKYGYDDAGRMISITTEYGTVEFEYDFMNMRTCIRDAMGNTTHMEYDKMGNLIKKVLPNGYDQGKNDDVCYLYRYDAFDRLIQTIDPMKNVYAVKYNADGKIIKEINPNYYDQTTDDGIGIEYLYDYDLRRIKTKYPTGGVSRTKYDPVGNVVKTIDPVRYDIKRDDGPGTQYTYDEMNRLVMIKDPDGNVVKKYIYDIEGRLVKEIDTKGYLSADKDENRYGTIYKYNSAGWLTEKRVPVEKQSERILYNITQYVYDKAGRRIEEKRSPEYVDENNFTQKWNVIFYSYDRNGRIVRISDSTGAQLEYAYDCLGNRILEKARINDSTVKTIRYCYNSVGLLERKVDEICGSDLPANINGKAMAQTIYEYDKNGDVTKIVSPEGYQTLMRYDGSDRIVQLTKCCKTGIERTTTFEYDKAGNLVKEVDCNGNAINYDYDSMNRRIRIKDKEDGITRLFYDKSGNIIKHITPQNYIPEKDNGKGTIFLYDNMNRLVEVWNALGNAVEKNRYNPSGELIERTDALQRSIEYTYDIGGRIKRIITPGAKQIGSSGQEYTYDALGNITGIKDGEDNFTHYTLDLWGRITEITKADGSSEKYGYDYAGNVIYSTDGNGNTTEYAYNSLNLLSSIKDPVGGMITYKYDMQGRLVKYTDRNQQTIEYLYNLDNNIVQRKEITTGTREEYRYNTDGSLQAAVSGGYTFSYLYTPNMNLKRKSINNKTVLEYKYDKNSKIVELNDFTGRQTNYKYDILGRVEEVWDSRSKTASYEYNIDDTISSIHWENGTRVKYGYDDDKNISEISAINNEGIELLKHIYAYDKNGNQVKKQENESVTLYHYDSLNRLSKVVYPDAEEVFLYDKAGNRTSRKFRNITTLYGYDNRNRLLEMIEGDEKTSYYYDLQGNLLRENSAKGTIRYTYDCFNRTASVEKWDGSYIKNRYDPEGLRSYVDENGKKSSFIFDEGNVIAELDSLERLKASSIRGYELLAQKDNEGNTYFYLNNSHGDVTALVNEAGAVVNWYQYDAFGNVVEEHEKVHNRFKYAGEQYDIVTGQYYLRARFYNPVVGRFTQEDVYRGDGLNLYAYVANNPVNYVDPSGYSAREDSVGGTPGKKSATGREVIKRMKAEGRISEDGTMYKSSDGKWRPIDSSANMAHIRDAVEFWNSEGKYYGKKNKYSRKFMLNPNNYELEHEGANKSKGAKLGVTYDEVPKSLQERIDFIEKNKERLLKSVNETNDVHDLKQYNRQIEASDKVLKDLKAKQAKQIKKSQTKVGGKCSLS